MSIRKSKMFKPASPENLQARRNNFIKESAQNFANKYIRPGAAFLGAIIVATIVVAISCDGFNFGKNMGIIIGAAVILGVLFYFLLLKYYKQMLWIDGKWMWLDKHSNVVPKLDQNKIGKPVMTILIIIVSLIAIGLICTLFSK